MAKRVTLTFNVVTDMKSMADALNFRDDIIDKLQALGIRPSVYRGTEVTLAAEGVITLGEALIKAAGGEPDDK